MPKVLVTGASGLLGREILTAFERAGWQAVGTALSRTDGTRVVKMDLCSEEAIIDVLEEQGPDFVIHSAANRDPASVQSNPTQARTVNVSSTRTLTRFCAWNAIPVVYISTDYVFPGRRGEAPYAEAAVPAPTNLYGDLKLQGEKAVLEAAEEIGPEIGGDGLVRSCVLRVPVLYGRVDERVGNKESAVNVLVDRVQDVASGKDVSVDDWAVRYPTCTEDVAAAVLGICQKWEQGKVGKGLKVPRILHFSAGEPMTKWEMCKTFGHIMGLEREAEKIRRDDAGAGADGVQRPYNTHLGTEKIRELLGEVRCHVFKEWWTRELKR